MPARPPKSVYTRTSFGVTAKFFGSPTTSIAQISKIGEDTAIGSSVPGYRVKIAKKQDASSGYRRNWFKLVQAGNVACMARHKTYPNDIWTVVGGWNRSFGNPASDARDSLSKDIATQKIKRKIQSDNEDYAVLENLLQDIYEFRKTVHGTLDSVYNLLSATERIVTRSGRMTVRNRNGMVSELANLWLSWSFGIKPTLGDAEELAASISSYLKRTDHVKVFTGSHYNDSKSAQIFLSQSAGTTGMRWNFHFECYRKYSARYITAQLVRYTSGNNYASFNEQFHLSASDFVPTLWEWLPFSWIIDYVTTAGDFFTDVFQSSTTNSSIYTINNARTEYNMVRSLEPVLDAGWEWVYKTTTPEVLSTGIFERTPLGALPFRDFRFRTQYEIENNLTNKILNLAAVLRGQQTRSRHHSGA